MTFQRVSFVAAVVAALVAGGVVHAQPGPPPAGPQAGQRSGPPPAAQAGAQPAQGPQAGRQPAALGLQLTEEQRSKIQALTIEHRDRARLAQATAQSLNDQLSAEVWADKPDEAKIKQLRGELLKTQQEMIAARFDQQAKIAQILTPEQRKRARDLRAQRLLRGARGPAAFGMGAFRRGMGPRGFGRRLQRPGPQGAPGTGRGALGIPGRGLRRPGVNQPGQSQPGRADRLPWWLRDEAR